MKDKILNLKSGKRVYVLEMINYNNNDYILTVDIDKDIIRENYQVFKVENTNGNITIHNVDDKEIIQKILENIKNNS